MGRYAFDRITGIDGNRGLYLGHREEGGIAEVAAFSLWSSWSAVRALAGDEPDRVAELPDDHRFLVDQRKTMESYKIFAATSVVAGLTGILKSDQAVS
jgi:hypothetical protein